MADSFCLFVGWLVDGTGGPILRNVMLQVEEGAFLSIDDDSEEPSPGPLTCCFPHSTLVPGLIDSHVHLAMSGVTDREFRERQLQAAYPQVAGVVEKNLRAHLAHGVVAVRDGGDYGGYVSRYKRQRGERLPISVQSAGKAWRAAGQYGGLMGRPPEKGDSLAAAILKDKEPGDHIKIVNSGLNSLAVFGKQTRPQFSLEELKGAVETLHGLGLKAMVHANGKEPVRLAIKAGVDSIEHGFFMGLENLERMAARQVVWVPTVCTMKAYHACLSPQSVAKEISQRNLEHQLQQVAKALELGVPLAVGTDSGSPGVNHGESISEEMGLFIEAGFSTEKAIHSATGQGARLMGLERQHGAIRVGTTATGVILEGPPSRLARALKRPQRVMVAGTIQ